MVVTIVLFVMFLFSTPPVGHPSFGGEFGDSVSFSGGEFGDNNSPPREGCPKGGVGFKVLGGLGISDVEVWGLRLWAG